MTIRRIAGNESTSFAIIDAIATQLNTDALDLEPPLIEVINLDVLDELSNADSVVVSFSYGECEVTVNDSQVEVTAS